VRGCEQKKAEREQYRCRPVCRNTLHGRVFSIAIRPAITVIQTMLMIPSAKNDAINAQQQPTHQAPFFTPICKAPDQPSRQEPSNIAIRTERRTRPSLRYAS
jgi:hypothetical protein